MLNDAFAQSFGQENMTSLRAMIRKRFLEQEAGTARADRFSADAPCFV